jgi:cellulose synthase/poly-beta-1,6-N-acetylglucosamine synthase-like glycosyltransferase
MTANPPKSLGEAIDGVIASLTGLDQKAQQTAIKAACEHLGLPATSVVAPPTRQGSDTPPPIGDIPILQPADIRTFKETKQPKTANEVACLVAHYLESIAPHAERKDRITTADIEGPLLLAAATMRAMSNGGIQPAWSRVLSPNELALISDSDWKTIKEWITAGKILGKKLSDNTQNRPNSHWNDVLELLTTGVIVAWAGSVSYWLVFMNFANGHPLLASINLIQLPFSIAFMAYPLSFVVGAFSSFFYPSKMFAENSKYYSAVPQQKTEDTPWPPVTIQIPVYNEKFEGAIQLTLESAMRARGNYIEKGGAANIIVNDDGIMMFLKNDLGAFDRLMALVRAGGTDEGLQRDEREAFLRLKYYTENGIGFTARPTQNRLGKFKKAGNMNYGMIQLSEAVDDLLAEDGKQVYDEVLMRVSRGRSPPAAASGDIQFGKFIVLLDADSRMHPDIIAMTIPEFLSDPALGFTQHPNLPFNGDENYFSRAIARFTENLYHIVFAVMSRGGCPAPLTGHGVFLNVEAMKKIAFKDEDGLKKYWNEKRVSEDFDMSMALQSLGYIGRYIDFAGYEFAEGVTRNFDEEVKKLSKFGCGASEMIFHPIRDWFRKGILTPQIKQYLTSDTPLSAKTSMMKYLFSYFGIASVFVMLPMQLLLIATGYEWNTVIVSSLILSCQNTAIFAVIGPLSSLIVRWKLNQNSIYRERDGTAWNQVKTEAQFIPVFSLLFIGAMFMIFKGVASHLLGLDIRWGATNKDKLEDRNFRDSVREVWSSSGQQIWLGSVAFASIVTAYLWMPTSFSWHIFFGPTVLAAGHVIAPFLLNPAFMANFSKKQAKFSDTDSVGARLAEEAKLEIWLTAISSADTASVSAARPCPASLNRSAPASNCPTSGGLALPAR